MAAQLMKLCGFSVVPCWSVTLERRHSMIEKESGRGVVEQDGCGRDCRWVMVSVDGLCFLPMNDD